MVKLVQGSVFLLETIASEEIVLWLVSNGSNQIVLGGNVVSMLYLLAFFGTEDQPRSQRRTIPKFPSRVPFQFE
jgi:hypothetical protein